MGLGIVVGALADLLENDPEGAEWVQKDMENLNGFLASQNLPPHNEPKTCEIYFCDMIGYSGLHYLRRIAAGLALNSKLLPPGNPDSSKLEEGEDPMTEYQEKCGELFMDESEKATECPLKFTHLIAHSDAEGYYIPQDFSYVLLSPSELKLADFIGSSNQLLAECEELAKILELPLDIDPEDEKVFDAVELQGKGNLKWQKYGIESYHCLRLYKAAKHSIASGAAIKFC